MLRKGTLINFKVILQFKRMKKKRKGKLTLMSMEVIIFITPASLC